MVMVVVKVVNFEETNICGKGNEVTFNDRHSNVCQLLSMAVQANFLLFRIHKRACWLESLHGAAKRPKISSCKNSLRAASPRRYLRPPRVSWRVIDDTAHLEQGGPTAMPANSNTATSPR